MDDDDVRVLRPNFKGAPRGLTLVLNIDQPFFDQKGYEHWKIGVNSPSPSPPTFSVRPRSSVGRVTVDLIRRSWVRFPPRSKYFFFTSCGSLIPFTRANAQWVIHGFI